MPISNVNFILDQVLTVSLWNEALACVLMASQCDSDAEGNKTALFATNNLSATDDHTSLEGAEQTSAVIRYLKMVCLGWTSTASNPLTTSANNNGCLVASGLTEEHLWAEGEHSNLMVWESEWQSVVLWEGYGGPETHDKTELV